MSVGGWHRASWLGDCRIAGPSRLTGDWSWKRSSRSAWCLLVAGLGGASRPNGDKSPRHRFLARPTIVSGTKIAGLGACHCLVSLLKAGAQVRLRSGIFAYLMLFLIGR